MWSKRKNEDILGSDGHRFVDPQRFYHSPNGALAYLRTVCLSFNRGFHEGVGEVVMPFREIKALGTLHVRVMGTGNSRGT